LKDWYYSKAFILFPYAITAASSSSANKRLRINGFHPGICKPAIVNLHQILEYGRQSVKECNGFRKGWFHTSPPGKILP
jgi:hypothetical protein